MSSEPREAKARRGLSEQIEQLKALRTANVRDTEFKQWRQSTLTIIQRIWPGEGRRSARFRRIPFSPPSSQASMREVREYYERGCAEAAQLLKAFLDEVVEDGVPEATEQARPASFTPGVAEDDFPTLDLPGGPPKSERPRPAQDDVDSRPGAVSIRGSHGHEGGARRNGPERRKKQGKNAPRRRLRDMLGLDALESLGGAGETQTRSRVESAPPAAAGGKDEDVAARAAEDAPVRAAEVAPVRAAESAHVPGQSADESADDQADGHGKPVEAGSGDAGAPGAAAGDLSGGREGEDAAGDPDEDGVPFTADEFLSASPIFRSEGKPVRRANREPVAQPLEGDLGPAPLTSSAAIAVAAIAAEVARLGVPDAQRARTRATLVNLSQLIEEGDLDWESLRAAVAFAMEHPPIGRRLLPLLIPFLDRAA